MSALLTHDKGNSLLRLRSLKGKGGGDGKGRSRGNSRGAYSSYKRRCFRCNSEDQILKDCPIEEANHVDVEEVNMNVHICWNVVFGD